DRSCNPRRRGRLAALFVHHRVRPGGIARCGSVGGRVRPAARGVQQASRLRLHPRCALLRPHRLRRMSLTARIHTQGTQVAALALTVLLIAGLSSSQGGYFPTSWGWSSGAALLVIAVWAVLADATEIRRIDLIELGLLTLLFLWTLLSAAWSGDVGTSVHEAQRTLVLV